jgi:hypothetical protein
MSEQETSKTTSQPVNLPDQTVKVSAAPEQAPVIDFKAELDTRMHLMTVIEAANAKDGEMLTEVIRAKESLPEKKKD